MNASWTRTRVDAARLRVAGSGGRGEGKSIGFGTHDLDDPLAGCEGVRGTAFLLADAALPSKFDDATIANLSEAVVDLDEACEGYVEARRFIAERALVGQDVLIN